MRGYTVFVSAPVFKQLATFTRAERAEIRRIVRVSGYVTPCTWTVETDRGETAFVLKSEESIRRLSRQGLLIADSRGISFLVRDMRELDAGSFQMVTAVCSVGGKECLEEDYYRTGTCD